MNRIAGLLLVGGVLLLVSWVLAPAAPVSAPAAPPAASLEQTAPVVAQVNAEVDRLRERLETAPQFPPPSRDPFRFGARPEPPRRVVAPTVEAPAAPLEPPAPKLPLLVAITANSTDGVLTRTAVLAEGDDVHLVKDGDKVGRFVVRSVSADAAELLDPATSRTYRLVLK